MMIIKQGKDLSKEMTCPRCGCVFTYQPGEVETQYEQIYNVPEVFWRSHGGRYDPVEIRHRHIVRCPSCKSKCNTESWEHQNFRTMSIQNERIKDWREKCCDQCKYKFVEYNGKQLQCGFSKCTDEEVVEFDEHNGCQGIREYIETGIFPERGRK